MGRTAVQWEIILGIIEKYLTFIDDAKYLVRPANFPKERPAKGLKFLKLNQLDIAVINLQARNIYARTGLSICKSR